MVTKVQSLMIKFAPLRQLVGNLIILIAYLYGTLKVSLYSDDYTSMLFTLESQEHAFRDLRPGQGMMVYLGFETIVNDPHNIWILKCLSLLGLLVLYHLVISRIHQSKRSWFVVIGTAVGFCITPFQMYVHWATCWYFTWVAVFGIYAYSVYRRKGWHNKAIALIILAICISTYPITAYSFVVFYSVISLINEMNKRLVIKEAITQIWFAIQATLISTFCSLLILKLKNLEPNSRVEFVTIDNIPEKLFWLVTRPMVIGLRPFQVSSPSTFGALLSIIPWIILLVLYVFTVNRRVFPIKWESVLLPILLVAVSLAPLIVTSDNQFEFRLIPSYSWLVVVFIFILLGKLGRSLKPIKLPINLVAFTLVIIAVTTTNLTYYNFFLNPYRTKTQFLSEALSKCDNLGTTESVVILRPVNDFPSFLNLGILSQSTDLMSDWVPVANVKLVGESLGLKLGAVTYPTNRVETEDSNCNVDLEEYRQEILGNLR
jgi:hypothetical protein